MSGMYSKYHADGGAPFPGADAVALAAGMPDGPEQPATAAVPLCIDCRWCTDDDMPTLPGNLVCLHPDPYLRTGVFYCDDRRRVAHFCGDRAAWFEDALCDI